MNISDGNVTDGNTTTNWNGAISGKFNVNTCFYAYFSST